jgi:hypothetical protein
MYKILNENIEPRFSDDQLIKEGKLHFYLEVYLILHVKILIILHVIIRS